MITDNKSTYQEAKNRVLSVYESFIALTGNELIKEVIKPSQNVLESLDNQIKRVKEDKFKLMVAGEAKCGKSTFINAYLGVDILPMDVMQCTSAIIEIKYGQEFLLEAEYADGEKKQIKGEDKIRQFLKENAAIDENYRSIPVPVINTEILMKSKGNPSPRDIKNLIEGVKEANVYNLSEKDYEQKIREYINIRKATWNKIVIKLTVYYPFESEELKGIEIIDSPGVNAAGKIGDSTERYIKNADAIMFLKPLTGAALESSDFKRFLEETSNEKSKSTLFLLLTRAADSNVDDINTLCQQAKKLYPGIASEQILPIDSKAQLFKESIKDKSVEDIEQLIMSNLTTGKIDNFILRPWMISDKNKNGFIENLEDIARFEPLKESIDEFGRKAHYIRLKEILQKIIKQYIGYIEVLKHEQSLKQQRIKDPEQFVINIAKLKAELEKIKINMNEGLENLVDEYTGSKGLIYKYADDFEKKAMKMFKDTSGKDLNELKQITQKLLEEYDEIFTLTQSDLINRCNAELYKYTGKLDIPITTLEVNLTDLDFKEIEKRAVQDSIETEKIKKGVTFEKVEEKSVFNSEKYAKIIRDNILNRLREIIEVGSKNLKSFVEEVLLDYQDKLILQAQNYKDRLDVIQNEKKENDELEFECSRYQQTISELEIECRKINLLVKEV